MEGVGVIKTGPNSYVINGAVQEKAKRARQGVTTTQLTLFAAASCLLLLGGAFLLKRIGVDPGKIDLFLGGGALAACALLYAVDRGIKAIRRRDFEWTNREFQESTRTFHTEAETRLHLLEVFLENPGVTQEDGLALLNHAREATDTTPETKAKFAKAERRFKQLPHLSIELDPPAPSIVTQAPWVAGKQMF